MIYDHLETGGTNILVKNIRKLEMPWISKQENRFFFIQFNSCDRRWHIKRLGLLEEWVQCVLPLLQLVVTIQWDYSLVPFSEEFESFKEFSLFQYLFLFNNLRIYSFKMFRGANHSKIFGSDFFFDFVIFSF